MQPETSTRRSYPPDDPDADARLPGVDQVFYLDIPNWYHRHVSLTWRRGLAVMAGLFVTGAVIGLAVGFELGRAAAH